VRVRFRKSPVGPHFLSCRRDDGSETYGQIPGQPGIPHDLIHFVVEQTLGLEHAFFGTVASGVGIPDAAERWRTLPPEARAQSARAEQVVAWFQRPDARMPDAPATAQQLAAIQARLDELVVRWNELSPKDVIELEWSEA
jgi:hypothetical protein